METTRTAALEDETDLLSHTLLGQTVKINGKTWTSAFAVAARTQTTTSPEGRVSETVIDDQGRPVTVRAPCVDEVSLTYDDRGRVTRTSQGQDDRTRSSTYTYHESGAQKGRLATATDPAGRTVSYTYDAAGRIIRQDLPGDRTITYTYDPDGNLTGPDPSGPDASPVYVHGPGPDRKLRAARAARPGPNGHGLSL